MLKTVSKPAGKPTIPRLFPPNLADRKREQALDNYILATRNLIDHLSGLSDSQLVEHLASLRADVRINDQDHIVEDFICAAAIGAEAVKRTLGFRMHDVQIRGALAAANGSIIEMQTGEGKTVVCGVTALIRSVFDQAVHVATTNDYLAERDHESVAPIFRLLKTSSAVIKLDASDTETRAAYRCQITYGPGYLFGFDYLRDQIKLKEVQSVNLGRDVLISINGRNLADELSQYVHQSIIVDEADSVLIDESTTPLILSGGVELAADLETVKGYENARQVADTVSYTHLTLPTIYSV